MKRGALGAGAEFDLIGSFLHDLPQPVPGSGVVLGPGDDCAVIIGDGVALSVDMSVEGVHFTRDWLDPEEIGYRAAAAAVSDLAAVAARPIGVLVAIAVPTNDEAWATRVMTGVRSLLHAQSAALLGGDLTRSPGPLVIDVVAAGSVVEPVLRSGATPGQAVWVTGGLGGAAAAVQAWQAGRSPHPDARSAFAAPIPRTAEAAWLARHVNVGAMIDLSDGLASDAEHIAAASGVRIVVDAAAVPLHASLHRLPSAHALALALGGGEDYELCFTADTAHVAPVVAEFQQAFGVALTRVGDVEPAVAAPDDDATIASRVWLRHADGRREPMPFAGFDHMRGDAP